MHQSIVSPLLFKAKYVGLLLCAYLLSACSSFYQINYEFNRNFENGNLEEAERVLKANKKAEKGKARFIYYLDAGVVNSLLGKYEESNQYFEKAYLIGEDYQKNYLHIAASMFTNPNIMEYRGEDHEHLMVLYYKALNFLKMGNTEAALIECRRLNLRLANLSDRYQADFKYKEDAFIHLLMGIIYDADKDYNNAFIAYRNAVRIYEEHYTRLFGLGVPEQLKLDIMRTAYLMGFKQELSQYEAKFDRKYSPREQPDGGELVMFWNNGLGPVKAEWSINFTVVKGSGGMVNFVNEEYGINLPFMMYDDKNQASGGLGDLSMFRVAFPKYMERPAMFSGADLVINGRAFPLGKAEDVNGIAFKLLEQRMLAEFGKSLLRFALKKATEQGVRSENEGLGALLGMVNAATEKADTRNWQTLPHSIYYARVPLKAGLNEIDFQMKSSNGQNASQTQNLKFEGIKGQTIFHTFHSLEISPRYMSRGY